MTLTVVMALIDNLYSPTVGSSSFGIAFATLCVKVVKDIPKLSVTGM